MQILKEEKMADSIHFYRVTIHLKNGTNLV